MENKLMLSLFFLKQLFVYIQLYFRLIAVNFYFRYIFRTVNISSAADMDKGLAAPVCFIEIKRIFFSSSDPLSQGLSD